jgi:hypothetical protein
MANAATPIPGIIEPEKLYRLETIKAASGVGDWGLRQMRKAGLKVRYVGGRGFIKGADFIAHVEKAGDEQHANAAAQ